MWTWDLPRFVVVRAVVYSRRRTPKNITNKGAPLVFNSLTFVVFFAVVFVLHRMPFSWTAKKVNLLVASYVFYAAWNPPFIVLLWVSTIVDWFIARGDLGLARQEPRWCAARGS